MGFLIATDEAGYGPSLGPLVITATDWQCGRSDVDLYQLLNAVITDSPKALRSSGKFKPLLVADSKIANRSGKIGTLERTVLVMLRSVFGKFPATLKELMAMVSADENREALPGPFWLDRRRVTLPLDQPMGWEKEAIEQGARFQESCDNNELQLTKVRSTIIQPNEFNAGVTRYSNKANLLSIQTMQLVQQSLNACDGGGVIECDKHGGRTYYESLISETLTDRSVKILCETRPRSSYRFERDRHQVEINFTAKGESQLAVALSSMVSKYIREIFMKAWNEFWQSLDPTIKPTKGYPQDAKRFLTDIQSIALTRNLSKDDYWRCC